MKKILNWKARQSGGSITITGTSDNGQPVNVTNIEAIKPRYCTVHQSVAGLFGRRKMIKLPDAMLVIATHKDGSEFELA